MATLGNIPWYVGPAMTRFWFLSDRRSGPTTTTDGPRYLTKCHPVPVIVKRSRSWLTLRRISIVVWCWNNRYISMAIRPMFLNMADCCIYAGYEPKPSNLCHVREYPRQPVRLSLTCRDHQFAGCEESAQTLHEGKAGRSG